MMGSLRYDHLYLARDLRTLRWRRARSTTPPAQVSPGPRDTTPPRIHRGAAGQAEFDPSARGKLAASQSLSSSPSAVACRFLRQKPRA